MIFYKSMYEWTVKMNGLLALEVFIDHGVKVRLMMWTEKLINSHLLTHLLTLKS